MNTKTGKNLALATTLIVFCLSTAFAQSGSNEGRKRGARGGALLGLTMGVVAGDAGWAVKGAAVGAVAGGVAGNMQDYENDREDYRTDTLAGAIASNNSGGGGEAPQGWNDIDAFVGTWQVNAWVLDEDGDRHDFQGTATSSLDTTQSVTFRYSNFDDLLEEGISGSTTLSFSPDRGFEMINQFSTEPDGNRYVGNFNNGENKFIFFYAGSNQETFSGIQRSDYRLEMQMVGRDVIVIETMASIGSEELRIQSYRFTRTG